MDKQLKGLIIKSVVAFVVFFGAICTIKIVPANNVGIRYSNLSGVSETTLNEGMYIVVPFVENIYNIDTTVHERSDSGVTAQTMDAQYLTVDLNTKYRVNRESAFKVFQKYGSLTNLTENIIGNYAQDAINEVFSQYNVMDLLGEKRNEAINTVKTVLAEKFVSEGITLESLTIKDMDAGTEIENAIKAEGVAKKAVETAKQEQEKARAEAETEIIKAEAEAKKQIIAAEAEAEANRKLAESITDNLIKMKEAEARLKHGWVTVNGAATVVTDGD